MHTSFSSFQFATSSLFLVHFFLSNFKCLHFSRVGSKCFSPLNLYSFSKQYHAHQMLPSSTILMAQTVKRLSTMWETWVRSLGWEVPWRRKRQPTPVVLPRKSHGWRSLVSMGSQRVRHDWATSLSLSLSQVYETSRYLCIELAYRQFYTSNYFFFLPHFS